MITLHLQEDENEGTENGGQIHVQILLVAILQEASRGANLIFTLAKAKAIADQAPQPSPSADQRANGR